jgi:predicted DNA-binding antitoxin AbrB/MazE fold protein
MIPIQKNKQLSSGQVYLLLQLRQESARGTTRNRALPSYFSSKGVKIMKAYKAIYNQGQFVPLEPIAIPEGSNAIVTVLDFPVENFSRNGNPQLAAFEALIAEIHESGEEVPSFERVQLNREFEL